MGEANVSNAWYRTLFSLRIVIAVPPSSATILFANRTAPGSPSTPNGTPAMLDTDLLTNVMPGCTDATPAAFWRKGESTSLVSAPLEWKTNLPHQSCRLASRAATFEIASSGTVIQTKREASADCPSAITGDFTCRASLETAAERRLSARTIRPSILQPARYKLSTNALPSLPGPTMLTLR